MAAVLALLSAVAYGAGDFLGGMASKRLPPAAVVLRSNAVGLLGLFALMPLVGIEDPAAGDFVIGALGGIAGGIGIVLLYRGLATGTMSVVAPITAVLSALVPVSAGLVGGERPSAIALVGVPLALVAIALLAREPEAVDAVTAGTKQVVLALAAGLGFGLFFVALDATGDDAGLWPVVAARTASVAMFALAVATTASARVGTDRGRVRGGTMPGLLLGCGVLDAGANALFLLATQRGLLALVAVLGALYPASTLLLARLVLGERLARLQQLGVAVAAVAVVLVTAG